MDELVMRRSRPAGWQPRQQSKPSGARKAVALALLAVLLAACGFVYQAVNVRLVQHQYFEVNQATHFSTWTLPLPFRYRLVGTSSTPAGGQDSIWLLRPDGRPAQ